MEIGQMFDIAPKDVKKTDKEVQPQPQQLEQKIEKPEEQKKEEEPVKVVEKPK